MRWSLTAGVHCRSRANRNACKVPATKRTPGSSESQTLRVEIWYQRLLQEGSDFAFIDELFIALATQHRQGMDCDRSYQRRQQNPTCTDADRKHSRQQSLRREVAVADR